MSSHHHSPKKIYPLTPRVSLSPHVTIAGLKRDLTDLRKQQIANNNLVQLQLAAIRVDMVNLTNIVMLMGNQLHRFGLSLLAGCDEKMIERRISTIDNSLIFEMQCASSTEDPARLTTIKNNVATLQTERRSQTLQLGKANALTMSLLGPAPSQKIAPYTPVTIICAPTPAHPPHSTLHLSAATAILTPACQSPDLFCGPPLCVAYTSPHHWHFSSFLVKTATHIRITCVLLTCQRKTVLLN